MRGGESYTTTMKTELPQHLSELHYRIPVVCSEAGRTAYEVTEIPVTKGHSANLIQSAVSAGLRDIGENRVQEADAKIRELGPLARWHMI